MRRFVTFVLAVGLAFAGLFGKASVTSVQAASNLSPGCAYVNAHGGVISNQPSSGYAFVRTPLLTFYAGEVLTTYTVSSPSTSIGIYDYTTGTFLAGSNIGSQSASWQVPSTDVYGIDIGSPNRTNGAVFVGCTSNVPNGPAPLSGDGRVNGDSNQAGQTFAAYCNTDNSITVYTVNNGVGMFAFTATFRDILKASQDKNGNYVVKSALGATLYQLGGTNKFQVSRAEAGTGKTYSYVFSCGVQAINLTP